MSENFNNKEYSEYFKKIENQINVQVKRAENSKIDDSLVKNHCKQKNCKRIYKVIRLRFSAVAAAVLIIGGIIFGSVKAVGAIKSKGKNGTESSIISETVKNDNDIPARIVYKTTENTREIPETNDAKSAIIIDTETNSIVAQRNINQKAFPASTTKIMTLLTAVDNIKDFDDTFTMTLQITDPLFKEEASVAGFLDGEVISMTDLLYGTVLPSGADAAMGLAIKIAGSEENFVKLMNEKAKALGLKNTHFANVTGLHSENNYTTAYDMAILLNSAMQDELCKKVLSTYQYTTAITPQHPQGILLSSTLFSYMYGTEPETATIMGGKTGFVNESGYCIASFGHNNLTQKEYIVVTLGNSSRWPAFYGQIDLYKQFAK